jgi:hypothetical protein
MPAAAGFSQTYAQARRRFLEAAGAAGLSPGSHGLPGVPGQDGEALAMDVVRDGPPDAPRLLIVSSGCHGVEGFCGSGAQVALLADAGLRRAARQAGVALLFIHALNPYGFSWWRRVTHEGVDLNRNFLDFAQPLPPNPGYDRIAEWLLPPHWPPTLGNRAALLAYLVRHGKRALQQAVSGGQYHHPHGLFYGGRSPTWSHLTLREVLRRHGRSCRELAWIDLHSGLGPSGLGEKILACRDEPATLQQARAWWGGDITSIDAGTSTSATLSGQMWQVPYEECPQARYVGITLEYGTVAAREVMDALRGDHWLHQQPQARAAQAPAIRRRLRDAFYTDTDAWKECVVAQAVQAVHQAVAGLSNG